MQKLRNKVIWITGASSGIGEALAYELSSENQLILSARRIEELERVKEGCSNKDKVLLLPLDLVDTDSHESKVDEALKVVS